MEDSLLYEFSTSTFNVQSEVTALRNKLFYLSHIWAVLSGSFAFVVIFLCHKLSTGSALL